MCVKSYSGIKKEPLNALDGLLLKSSKGLIICSLDDKKVMIQNEIELVGEFIMEKDEAVNEMKGISEHLSISFLD